MLPCFFIYVTASETHNQIENKYGQDNIFEYMQFVLNVMTYKIDSYGVLERNHEAVVKHKNAC